MGLGEQELPDELVSRPVERPDGKEVQGERRPDRASSDRQRPTPAGAKAERDHSREQERRPGQLEEKAERQQREAGQVTAPVEGERESKR